MGVAGGAGGGEADLIRITLRDLQFRSLRFLITVIGTAVVFALVLLMTGLSTQLRTESRRTVRSFGADAWVMNRGADSPFTSQATVPEKLGRELTDLGTAQADPIVLVTQSQRLHGRKRLIWCVGYDLGGLGAPQLAKGRAINSLGETTLSEESGSRLGDRIVIGGVSLRVVGLTKHVTVLAGQPLVFMDIRDAQSAFFNGDAIASAVLVRGPVKKLPAGYMTRTPKAIWEDSLRTVSDIILSLRLATVLLWFAGVILMGAVIYLSALERLRDFAVFKALGSATGRLLVGLAFESVLVALLAGGAAVGVEKLIAPRFPVTLDVPVSSYLWLPLLAGSAGLLACLGGVRKAVKADPALAFAAAGG